MGDEPEGGSSRAADIVFIIEEKEHPKFKRHDNDLVIRHRISLTTALCGSSCDGKSEEKDDDEMKITTIDGRLIDIPATADDACIKPGSKRLIVDEGMPIRSGGVVSGKGNLIVEFDINWPSRLTETQKTAVRALGL